MRSVLPHRKTSKGPDFNSASLFQSVSKAIEKQVDNVRCLYVRTVFFFAQSCDEVCFVDDVSVIWLIVLILRE
jgi:hypothetical protein